MSVVGVAHDVIAQYRRFSVYNSPYPAHDRGCGIDLYPETKRGVSPVAGEVLDTRTVGCPDRHYAVDHDHLILIDTGSHVARVLHVKPAVEPGEWVAVGDPLGETVRSGFFGRWVDDHVHLEFREPDANPYRATGSLPIRVETRVEPLAWDGTGRVVERGPTHAVLDAPRHSDPGRYVALASDEGVPLDGGFTHYTGGGRLDRDPTQLDDGERSGANERDATEDALHLFGERVGRAAGRTVTWEPVDVVANGDRVTGLSLFASREADFGVKIVTSGNDHPSFELGEEVAVTVQPSDDPIRLG